MIRIRVLFFATSCAASLSWVFASFQAQELQRENLRLATQLAATKEKANIYQAQYQAAQMKLDALELGYARGRLKK